MIEPELRRLDSDYAIQAGVAGPPNFSHAACAQGCENLIRSEPFTGRKSHRRWPVILLRFEDR
jgi:hypothetical protein